MLPLRVTSTIIKAVLCKDAEMMYNRVLAGKEKARGPDHASTWGTFTKVKVVSMTRK